MDPMETLLELRAAIFGTALALLLAFGIFHGGRVAVERAFISAVAFP